MSESHGLPEGATLDDILAWASLVLPEQGPLPAFVHHNTLHHFEHLPFTRGVVEGARLLGSQPYQSEAAFGQHVKNGRITPGDIHAVLALEHASSEGCLFEGGPTTREFRQFRLLHALAIPNGRGLDWFLHEDGEALTELFADTTRERRAELREFSHSRFVDHPEPVTAFLEQLWRQLEAATPSSPTAQPISPRPRDQVLAHYAIDTDLAVHSLLIRFTASFLDQGLAYWTMPGREKGMLNAFRSLYSLGGGPPDTAFRGLDAELRRQHAENWDSDRTITWALKEMSVADASRAEVIRLTLQSLRGWAGMVRQFEVHPDWAPVQAPPSRLKDYLAIHLLLDWCGWRNVTGGKPLPVTVSAGPAEAARSLTYEAFLLAQLSNVKPSLFLNVDNARAWLRAVAEFDDVERRRVWHLAFERRYRTTILDALAVHVGTPEPTPARTTYQAVFCIDDREESLRRHLEETFPDVQTFGMAGFFGVAMEYQGLHDVRPRALCPVVVTPKHLVREVPIDAGVHANSLMRRSQAGRTEHAFAVGTRTLVRGSLLSAGLGLAALLPLIGRSLFPRAAHRWLHARPTPPPTRLAVEREPGTAQHHGLDVGYTVCEMVSIVANTLRTLGIADNLSPLILVVGHGSSSLNNPHRAAYDCGATGGGKGGPNARAFAVMANHPEVRKELALRGMPVPEGTHFVGAFHDTADDSMTYYDVEAMPPAAGKLLEPLASALLRACEADARERCRRFIHAPLDLSAQEALYHVEGRAADIGQPRPECGHATNAVCIVGRRERTRGLFLDRRAFLVTYDPNKDPSEEILANLMQAIGPVGAGINLEYYFSYVDPKNYGCGSKLPHNLVGLFGVMDGHASDLRTGLPWQMVEIHEPVRLLTIVEAKCEVLERLLDKQPAWAPLVKNEWILLVALDPDSSELFVFEHGRFVPYVPEVTSLAQFDTSVSVYQGHREHLPCVRVGIPKTKETPP